MRLPTGDTSCTHGPDPAPAGIDVTKERSFDEIAAHSGEVTPMAEELTATPTYCHGDGASGNRVQAVYAYSSGSASHYTSVAPYIRQWATAADRAVNESALKNAGVRHVRWVTTPDCQIDVMELALSPAGIESFSGTIGEFAALGLNRPDRKYVVWVDAYVYCGMGNVSSDDRPSQDNVNNGAGRPGMIGRIDRGCWGRAETPIEVHELVHTLGGVQPTAPNGSGLYHCSDEADVMCYDDDGTSDGYVWAGRESVPIRKVCPAENERLLDCNGDDYFNVHPQPGSWLSKHWNVADSSFLTGEGPPVAPDDAAPMPTAPTPTIAGRLNRTVPVRLDWTSKDPDVAGYWLWKSVNGRPWKYVQRPDLWKSSVQLRLPRHRSYRFLVHAFDASGNSSPAVLGPAFRPHVYQERSRAVSYRGSWRRLYRSDASRRHVAFPGSTSPAARLTFWGKAVAWVSRTSLEGGAARVFVDGEFAGRVELSATTPAVRQVVFADRFARRGRHRIAVFPVEGSGPVALDAFVVLR
jgi:hypothetical protein